MNERVERVGWMTKSDEKKKKKRRRKEGVERRKRQKKRSGVKGEKRRGQVGVGGCTVGRKGRKDKKTTTRGRKSKLCCPPVGNFLQFIPLFPHNNRIIGRI